MAGQPFLTLRVIRGEIPSSLTGHEESMGAATHRIPPADNRGFFRYAQSSHGHTQQVAVVPPEGGNEEQSLHTSESFQSCGSPTFGLRFLSKSRNHLPDGAAIPAKAFLCVLHS